MNHPNTWLRLLDGDLVPASDIARVTRGSTFVTVRLRGELHPVHVAHFDVHPGELDDVVDALLYRLARGPLADENAAVIEWSEFKNGWVKTPIRRDDNPYVQD